MSRYILTRRAAEDLNDIVTYLAAEGGAGVARRTLVTLRGAMRLLSRYPGFGHFRADVLGREVRFWAVRGYVIVYDAARRPPVIVRVLHGSRDIAGVLSGPR